MVIEDITINLPMDAQDAGFQLIWYEYGENPARVAIITRKNTPLYEWPYVPSLGEAWDKAMELLKEGRHYD